MARSKSDVLFDSLNSAFFVCVLLIVLYPLYFIIIASFSDPVGITNGKVWFWPKGFNVDGYKAIFTHQEIWRGYRNSLFYTGLGTVINVVLTITAGYGMSRRDMIGRNSMMFVIIFTMFFSGGLIPSYLLVRDLGMINTVWALVIPGAVSAYNLIIVRTFFQNSLPHELLEAAQMDGCSDFKFFMKVAIPLSLPIIAVMTLFYAVGHWNSYFGAMLYLNDETKYPLQLVLRKILILSDTGDMMSDNATMMEQMEKTQLIKFGVIIVACLPVLILYPLLQRYFIKGVLIGSLKG
jgi:putative aldouronate transport system permease protein